MEHNIETALKAGYQLFKIPAADIWKIKVEQTWVAGERVY